MTTTTPYSPPNARPLGQQLRAARQAAGLTQTQLAARMGLTQKALSRLESEEDRNYRIETLRRYIEALGPGFSLEVTIRYPDTIDDTVSAARSRTGGPP